MVKLSHLLNKDSSKHKEAVKQVQNLLNDDEEEKSVVVTENKKEVTPIVEKNNQVEIEENVQVKKLENSLQQENVQVKKVSEKTYEGLKLAVWNYLFTHQENALEINKVLFGDHKELSDLSQALLKLGDLELQGVVVGYFTEE